VTEKEVVLFTQEKNFCIKHNCPIEDIDEKERKRIRFYGVMTGLSVVSQKFSKTADEVEIKNHFSRVTDFSEFITIVKRVGNIQLGSAVNRDIAFTIFKEYNLTSFALADIVLLNAYSDYVEKEEYTVIGYLDKVNGFLVYMIVGNGDIYQLIQRKHLKADLYSSKVSEDKVIELAEKELNNIIKMEKERVKTEISYVIAGLNDSFDRIIKSATSVAKNESLHKDFLNEKVFLYKQITIAVAIVSLIIELGYIPRYFQYERDLRSVNSRLNEIHRYLEKEDRIIKDLYVEKGKTIVLQDQIDISKLSKILRNINILPPGKIVYKNTKDAIEIDMYYVHHIILAQKYYNILKKNKKIGVQLFINPNMTVAKIHVVIPKGVLHDA